LFWELESDYFNADFKEEVIPKTITSFVSDASCILEALTAELDEETIFRALDRQGLTDYEYAATYDPTKANEFVDVTLALYRRF